MVRTLSLLAGLLFLPVAVAAGGIDDLERVGRAYGANQPALQTYRATVVTDQIDAMLRRMTANMPPGMPRPNPPLIRKYWSREARGSVMLAEGPSVFPYMQEMVERFSGEFAVEIRTLFLPPDREGLRQALFERGTVKSVENQLGDLRIQTLSLAFGEPVDLQGAFYGPGLELPQQGVTALEFDIDPDRRLLSRLEITTGDDSLTVEVRHREVEGGYLPREILVTNPAGTVDDRFLTEFIQVEGFWLPARQEQTLRRPGHSDSLTVTFSDYAVNVPLPDQALQRLAGN